MTPLDIRSQPLPALPAIAPSFPLHMPVDLDAIMLDLDPDYAPTPVVDPELERQYQAELAATRDLEYANSMKMLQFFLNANASARVAPAPLRERVNLSKWQLYEQPEHLKPRPVPAAAPVKPAMDLLQVPKADAPRPQTPKLDVKLDPSVIAAAVAVRKRRRGGF
ncbi:unnamed protein product [Peniophora sp. CBMAI 1063]|nr:unnamed protein product [Peniophora sp. CBMAI 1063]